MMTLHHVLEDIPDDSVLSVHDLLCRLDCLHDTALDQLSDDERLVKLSSHEFWKTALMHLELRTNDDHRTCRIVDTLTEEVLTETSLLTLE